MTEPIRRTMVRWQCPHCARTRSSRSVVVEHIGRCWRNPAAHSCMTCEHRWEPSGDGINEPFSPEGCSRGVALPDRGLPVHCPLWELASTP